MMREGLLAKTPLALIYGLLCTTCALSVAIDVVVVGSAGNALHTRYDGAAGTVGYAYQIGKYEITAGQHTEFLNAMANGQILVADQQVTALKIALYFTTRSAFCRCSSTSLSWRLEQPCQLGRDVLTACAGGLAYAVIAMRAWCVALSRRSLEKRFREVLGRTILKEIQLTRLDRAKRLLMETTHLISKVAKIAGFRSPRYFSHFFLKQVGKTPLKYRLDLTT